MKNESILAFYWGDWPRPDPNGPQCGPLVSLSEHGSIIRKILVVESPITILSPFIHPKKFWQWIKRLGKKEKINSNLSLFTPIVFLPYHPRLPLPVFLKKMLNITNNLLISFQVNRALKITNPILWLSMLHPEGLTNRFDHKLVCVLCYDEVSHSPIFTKKQQQLIREFEEKLLKKADLVFCTSNELYKNKVKINQNSHFIPNAIESDFIDKTIGNNTYVDINNIPKPRIGYIGKINIRLDFELIHNIAKNKPEWHWIFIGPVEFSADKKLMNKLKYFKNTHFIGEIPHFEIPKYLKYLDVLTIPFVLDEYTKNMNPLKLYQYLACGKPIVSTNLPEVAEFSRQHPDILKIADNKEKFIEYIELSLKEKNPELIQKRINLAKNNTWNKRTEVISNIIDKSRT